MQKYLISMNKQTVKERLGKIIAPERPGIFFMHIPKTGGTSINLAIKKFYRRNFYNLNPAYSQKAAEILYDLDDPPNKSYSTSKFSDHLALYEMVKGTKYISGHVRFNEDIWKAFHHQYAYVTVFRNPVKRYISNYFYDVYKHDDHAKIYGDFSTFIESKRGKNRGVSYINYIGGFADSDTCSVTEKFKVAKNNLAKFKLVGFLESIDTFTLEFKHKFGLDLKIPHKNKNPVVNAAVDDQIVDKIKKICEPDLEFYEYAKGSIG